MRTIPTGLAARLEGDATTLALAWRVTRRDGTVLGFTEHDRDLVFAGTTFLAASGFRGSESEAAAGLAVEANAVAGGFSSLAITQEDVVAGRYDGAGVETFLVDWAAPDHHLLLRREEIGEVALSGGAFRAELRRLTHRLDAVKGRIYGRRCDAVLGDGRCRVDLAAAGRRLTGTVLAVEDGRRLTVSGLSGAAAGAFSLGVLTPGDGGLEGVGLDIADHARTGGADVLTLWLPPPVPLSVGTAFAATVGCNKRFQTCRDRFSNALNFRGFPHMPGGDFAFGYADRDSVHDGSPLYDD
ncbi:DUF2163 domain-containing protein [Rhizobium sp. SG2393]|uniref:DUF2163 domain-containing protein n=1 Tax=Rhizobium sp. SG2393 TaxID=3276279 RepID=UPI003673238F